MKHLLSNDRSFFFNQVCFYSLLISGVYIIFLWSPNVLGDFFSRYTKSIIYIFPWLMLWVAFSWEVVINRAHRLEILLMITIIFLGVLNIIFSDSVSNSVASMRTFLFTGVFVLWAAMFLLADERRRQEFDWFCAGALAVMVLVEMIVYLVRGNSGPGVFQIFTAHAIPLGTVIILLSPGPVRLMAGKNFTLRAAGGLLVVFGSLLIFLTHKRGAWLALAAILLMGILYLARRRSYLVIAILLAVGLILPLGGKRMLARLDPSVPHDASILTRLELHTFALHIWKIHPVLGIGLGSATQAQYLSDYYPHNMALPDFPQAVATLRTFDNMGLTALVELGTLMTLVYLGLVIFILIRYGCRLWGVPESSGLEWYRGFVLLGFAVHSLSYNSLLVPPVNWLFHVQLGIMAGYQAPRRSPAESRAGAMGLSEA
jgi:hypothetical protein